MPLEDALSLVTRNFEKYLKTLREKPVTPSSKVLIPPDSQLSYLLNLLADGRHLTLDELQTVGDFVGERKRRLMEAEGIKPAKPLGEYTRTLFFTITYNTSYHILYRTTLFLLFDIKIQNRNKLDLRLSGATQ